MRLESDEEEIAECLRNEGAVDASDAEGAPDLLDPVRFLNEDATRQPAAETVVVFDARCHECRVEELEQVGGESSLQADRRLGSIAEIVIVTREQLARRVELGEVDEGVVIGVLLAPMRRTQPYDLRPLIEPGSAALGGDAYAVDEADARSRGCVSAPRATPERYVEARP